MVEKIKIELRRLQIMEIELSEENGDEMPKNPAELARLAISINESPLAYISDSDKWETEDATLQKVEYNGEEV